jgi:hypothetical protein
MSEPEYQLKDVCEAKMEDVKEVKDSLKTMNRMLFLVLGGLAANLVVLLLGKI